MDLLLPYPKRLRRALLGVLVALSLSAAPAAADPPFGPTSAWNAPLADDAPLVADSAPLVAELRRQVALPSGAWINTSSYSTPVYIVPAGQPTVRVALDVGYRPLQDDFDAVPLPDGARPAPGSDGHLTVYQPSADTLWEFWLMRHADDGWHARWGGKMTGVSRNPGYFASPLGATATSLPLLGGLMRIDELQAGRIDHALALAIPEAQAGKLVWPAQRTDGSSTAAAAIPEGTRFRLDPALDIDALALRPVAAMMAKAAQRYGLVVRDQSGAVTFYGEDPYQFGTSPYSALYQDLMPSQILGRFPWDRLQVVVPDQRAFAAPSSAPAPPAPAPSPDPVTAPGPTPAPSPAPALPSPVPALPSPVPAPPTSPAPPASATESLAPHQKSARRPSKGRCARKRAKAARKRCRAAARRRGRRGR
jgi:hypothetical protein